MKMKKSKTVFIVLGIGAAGAAAWWYMKNKSADAPPPTVVDKIMAKNPGLILAPVTKLPEKYLLKESTITTLPHMVSDLKMNSRNTGIVPPLTTPTTVKPAAIPAIAPPATIPKPTAAVSNTKPMSALQRFAMAGSLRGIGDAYSLN
jgi:hypothetical protein